MSRIERLKQYATPLRPENWQGEANDQANIDRWSQRATAESHIAPRASDGLMHLQSTGTNLRDTAMQPREARKANARMVAEADTNNVGDSPYLRGVRRQA